MEDIERRLINVEGVLSNLKSETAVITERQDRMHADMMKLYASIDRLANELDKLNSFITNKKGVLVGILITIGFIGSIIGFVLSLIWGKIAS